MANNKTAIKVLVVVGILGVATWYFTKTKTKEQMVNYLVAKGLTTSKVGAMAFDDAFITAWYNAAKSGVDKFPYNGNNHWTQGASTVITR